MCPRTSKYHADVEQISSRWEVVARQGSLKGKNAFEMQYDELMVEFKPRQEYVAGGT